MKQSEKDRLLGKRNAFPKLFKCCKCEKTRKRKYIGAVRNRELICKSCVELPTPTARS